MVVGEGRSREAGGIWTGAGRWHPSYWAPGCSRSGWNRVLFLCSGSLLPIRTRPGYRMEVGLTNEGAREDEQTTSQVRRARPVFCRVWACNTDSHPCPPCFWFWTQRGHFLGEQWTTCSHPTQAPIGPSAWSLVSPTDARFLKGCSILLGSRASGRICTTQTGRRTSAAAEWGLGDLPCCPLWRPHPFQAASWLDLLPPEMPPLPHPLVVREEGEGRDLRGAGSAMCHLDAPGWAASSPQTGTSCTCAFSP